MIGILEHIDGRKLTLSSLGQVFSIYLRKGVDSAQYLPLLQATVLVQTVEEKGFQMVQSIAPVTMAHTTSKLITNLPKPSLPVTEVEKTKPVDMPASANIPKLKFGDPTSFTTATEVQHKATQTQEPPRTWKDKDIMRQWAMGAVLNSHALANANDALALSTDQTVARAKKLAEELLKWVVER